MFEVKLNNGVAIPQLGLGVFQTRDGAETVNAVLWALEAGYRHIDTAMIYGNEKSVGQGMRESGIAREEIFLTTKLWNDDIRAGRAREAFEKSLSDLGTDYVDLYLIHWPVEGMERAWREMEALYREGRIRAIGLSNFHPGHLAQIEKEMTVPATVNQIECSPYLTQEPLIALCRQKGMAVEAWSPLGGTGGSLLSDETLARVGRKYGKSPAQVAIRWQLQRGVIVLPKSTHRERIRQNIDVFDFELSPEDMAAIDALNCNRHFGSNPDHFDF